MNRKLLIAGCFLLAMHTLKAQVGIGTATPDRKLEVLSGTSTQIRVHSSSNISGTAGLELVRGDLFDTPIDWKVINEGGIFKILSGNYNLNSTSQEHLRVTTGRNVGIGTDSPQTRLHIDNGEEASLNTDGYLMLGSGASANLIMDRNEIQARSNGNASNLYIQSSGGDTYFNSNGGDVLIASEGQFGIGTTSPQNHMGIEGDTWHIYISNNGSVGGSNDWYIAATSPGWAVGDHQLVFSPTNSSANAKFRLRNVSENDGNIAPIAILSSGNQELLMDGNEIESKSGALYINHNSGNETYLNPSGGQIGIGTTSLSAALTLVSPVGTDPLSIQRLGSRWDISPYIPDAGNPWGSLVWLQNNVYLASISGNTGNWFSVSDEQTKQDFRPMPEVLHKVNEVGVYRYTFKSDPDQRRYIGVMAQELQETFPASVRANEWQTGVAYGQLAVITLKAIQEQQVIIAALEAEIASLETSTQHSINDK